MSHAFKQLFLGGFIIMAIAGPANSTEAKLTIVNPQTLSNPAQYGYSHAVVSNATRIAHISGQGGQDSKGALSPDFAVQVKQAYANLRAVLDGIGAKPNQVMKLTVYVVNHDMSKLGVLTQNVIETFGDALPAQTLVPVPKLAVDGMQFEVDAVVALE